MQLNEAEEKILIDMGYLSEDIEQIKHLHYEFTLQYKNGKTQKISMPKARQELSKTDYLSGIGRAAFHGTSYRETANKQYSGILIESSLFTNI